MLPELEIENLSHEELILEAKQRRRNPTKAERSLWRRLSKGKMMGFSFRRHVVCKNFIFDYYCCDQKLVIEVDYSIGNLLKEYYKERDIKLQELGYQVLRFNEVQVLHQLSSVIRKIEKVIELLWQSKKASEVSIIRSRKEPIWFDNKHPIPSPSPREGKGTREAGGKGCINQEEPLHFPVSRHTRNLLIEQAREMRKNPTKAEALLWGELRAKKLAGYEFRCQHPIDSFFVDFYCPLRKLVIEIDGPICKNQKEYDDTRVYYSKIIGMSCAQI